MPVLNQSPCGNFPRLGVRKPCKAQTGIMGTQQAPNNPAHSVPRGDLRPQDLLAQNGEQWAREQYCVALVRITAVRKATLGNR